MNIDRPHEIVPESEILKRLKGHGRRRWFPLTDAEAAELRDKSEDERAEWLAAKPSSEYLARILDAEGLGWLAIRARKGEFSDFDSPHPTPCVLLDTLLKKAGRHDLSRRARAGEFDATRAESDAWADRQTGETKEIIDAMARAQRS